MSYDERVRNEEEHYSEKPQDNVSRAGLHGSAKEFGNDDDQNLGENQIEQAEFLAQSGAVGLDGGLGGLKRRVVRSGQESHLGDEDPRSDCGGLYSSWAMRARLTPISSGQETEATLPRLCAR
jgi:hypothetical protein